MKYQWEPFYPRDWLSDPAVAGLTLSAKGAWIGFLATMWIQRGYSVSGTVETLARMSGCQPVEMMAILAEYETLKTCNVTKCNETVMLVCRRLERIVRKRENSTKRVKKFRACNAAGTLQKDKKDKKDNTPIPPKGASASPVFEIPLMLNTPEFLEAWEDWQKHRKEKRKTLTATCGTSQLKTMAEWGSERAIAAIRYTIFKGWEGLREPQEHRESSSDEGPRLI